MSLCMGGQMRYLKKYLVNCIKSLDPWLAAFTLALSFVGLVTIFGAVDNFGKRKLIMQVLMTAAGIIFTVIIANIDYHHVVDRLWIFMIVFSVAILGITLIFGSSGEARETSNKAWLEIPIVKIAIQPSEFVKITMVCTFAKHLSLVRDRINKPLSLLLVAAHAGLIVGLILLSGDLGVALVYMGFLLIMLFCAGLSGWYYLGGIGVIIPLIPILWDKMADYQKKRIIVGFNPELDPLDKGLQPLMSKSCVENGGLFGIGLFGKGIYENLAASHTDFIFATVCEKFGICGGIFTVGLLLAMVVRILMIAKRCGNDYGAYICVGVAAIIIIQTVENIGMCLAMLPVIGITLPFVSCGGSSVLATYILVSLVHSVNRHRLHMRDGRV